MELEPVPVRGVEGRHDGAPDVRMGKAKGVTQLMGGCHQEVGAGVKVVRPPLIVIEMNIAAIDRKEGMGQSSPSAVKIVLVPMSTSLKPDLYVYFARAGSDKFQIGFSLPETQRLCDYPVISDGEGVIIIPTIAKQGLICPIG